MAPAMKIRVVESVMIDAASSVLSSTLFGSDVTEHVTASGPVKTPLVIAGSHGHGS